MGKQRGKIRISGTFDGLNFYQTDNKDLVRSQTGPTREQVLNNEGFKRTRENAEEFRRAISAGMLIRRSLREHLKQLADNTLTSRMNGLLKKVINRDETHLRGEREPAFGKLALLKGFNFNREHALAEVLPLVYGTNMNTRTGEMQVSIPAFIPRRLLTAPEGATHFRLLSAAVALDFGQNECVARDLQETAPLLLGETPTTLMGFRHHLQQVIPGQVLLLTTGIVFCRMVEGGIVTVEGGGMAVKQVGRKQPA